MGKIRMTKAGGSVLLQPCDILEELILPPLLVRSVGREGPPIPLLHQTDEAPPPARAD